VNEQTDALTDSAKIGMRNRSTGNSGNGSDSCQIAEGDGCGQLGEHQAGVLPVAEAVDAEDQQIEGEDVQDGAEDVEAMRRAGGARQGVGSR
jgi:hypothetical protein